MRLFGAEVLPRIRHIGAALAKPKAKRAEESAIR
jgi:hypothetical protein